MHEESEEMKKDEELKELYMRRNICLVAKRIVDAEKGDPRREDALEHYIAQLAEIDRRITEINGKPPDIVIGLQAARLSAEAQKGG